MTQAKPLLLILISILLSAVSYGAYYTDWNLGTDLEMFHKYDNSTDVIDHNGEVNNGVLGAATWQADCVVGGCFAFDGVENTINVTSFTAVEGSTGWTFSMWLYRLENQPASASVIKTANDAFGLFPDCFGATLLVV